MNNALAIAFPKSLEPAVSRLAPHLYPSSKTAIGERLSVWCGPDNLRIPYRINAAPLSKTSFDALDGTAQAVAACWFSRHNDGRVRERFLREFPAFDRPWIAGYVVALCGEYVIEILNYVWDNRRLFNLGALGSFLDDNMGFYVHLTKHRFRSYWNCYHRDSFPIFDDYVGSHLIQFFDDCVAAYQKDRPLHNDRA